MQHPRFEHVPVVVAGGDLQARHQRRPRLLGADDRVHPQPGSAVADVGLRLVAHLHPIAQLTQLGRVGFLLRTLQRLHLDIEERAGGLVAAHDGVPGRRPRQDEPRVERFAAQGVVPRAERPARNQRQLGDDAVRDDVHQLRPGPDDPGLLAVPADHEPVDVLHEQQRHPHLVAVHHEPRGLVRGIDVDDAAELPRPVGRLHPLLLVGDDPEGPAAEPTEATDEGLPVLGLVLVERGVGVEEQFHQLAHVVLGGRREGCKVGAGKPTRCNGCS
jgi:hypothetical protein